MSNEIQLWYEYHYSVLVLTPGEVPRTKGPWTDVDRVVAFLAECADQPYPDGTKLYVALSRCGELHVESAEDWLFADKIMREAAAEEEAYIKAGVCSGCGACNLAEAEMKCRPSEDSCPGDMLWQDQEEEDKNG